MTLSVHRASPLKQQTVSADFFTKTHRYSATVTVGSRRLADVLNDGTLSALDVKDAYISRIDKPGEIIGTYETASLMKDAINFVVVANETDAISQQRRYNSFIGQVRQDAFLVSTPFEVHGQLELYGKVDIKALLTIGNQRFMSLFSGKAVNAIDSGISFTGPAFLVNKSAIDFFSVLDKT
ncbi:MAG: hypothetical protein AAF629_10630 [Chloroflexota bacterium]